MASCVSQRDLPLVWKAYQADKLSWLAPEGYKILEATTNSTIFVNKQDTIEVHYDNYLSSPIPLRDAFKQSFDAVHYNKFFDKVLMDSKVKKMFRDSVTIEHVEPIDITKENSYGCPNCNVIAKLKFKKKIFDFPVQMSEENIVDHNCHNFKSEINGDYLKLTYRSKNKCGRNGVTIKKTEKQYMIYSNQEIPQIDRFLESIKLKF